MAWPLWSGCERLTGGDTVSRSVRPSAEQLEGMTLAQLGAELKDAKRRLSLFGRGRVKGGLRKRVHEVEKVIRRRFPDAAE